MGKRRGWFTFIKRLFIPEAKSKAEKKSKRWRWVLGRLKYKHCPAIAAPQKTLPEATEEQRMHALVVAQATAAAAEAAVAAAHAAAEVVRLTNVPYEFEKRRRNMAAITIQSAYRGYLGRKALSAMKGLVKLQAVIRGQNVRRRVFSNLRSMSSLSTAQLEGNGGLSPGNKACFWDEKEILNLKDILKPHQLKLESKSQRKWDFSLAGKQDTENLSSRKQEAIIKRERMKKYSFSHRERRSDKIPQQYSVSYKDIGGNNWSYNDQWPQLAVQRKEVTESLSSFDHSSISASDAHQIREIKLRNAQREQPILQPNSPFLLPRRSFSHVKHKSIGDDNSLPNSPVFPTYMAATESAKAKARSVSTPKQRLRLYDTYSGQQSPFKLKLSTWTSLNGEIIDNSRNNGELDWIGFNLFKSIKD